MSVLYPLKQRDDPEDLCGGRILDTKWIDSDLPLQWKSSCTQFHGSLCHSVPKSLPTSWPIWLIDIGEERIVPAPTNCSYVALSYVWGNQKTLEATRSNIDQLRQTGSLSMHSCATPIATTIRDAMAVAKLLGEKYLWVDTLCIVQDDPSLKYIEMGKMSGIYGNASVTIMAVQGKHANSGLRGFKEFSEPRNLHQSVHSLDGGTVVTQYPAMSSRFCDIRVEPSVWESRGWTYQEDIFSKRRLVFDGDSVRWECPASVMREQVQSLRDIRPPWEMQDVQALFHPSIPDLQTLQFIIYNYNARDFTYPEDALNAFAGLAFSLSPAFAGCFVSGLPSAFFDAALLWQASNRLSRRIARDPQKTHCLPSWSWAGWSGSVNFLVASASEFIRNGPLLGTFYWTRYNRVKSTSRWKYHETIKSPGVLIYASILESRDAWLEGNTRLYDGWSEHRSSENPKTKYKPSGPESLSKPFFKHESHPEHEFWYPIPLLKQDNITPGVMAPYISCQSRHATLLLENNLSGTRNPRQLSLLDSEQTWAGIIQADDTFEGQAVELVEIAIGLFPLALSNRHFHEDVPLQEEPEFDQWHQFYYVMWIEWHAGIAYRKGLGKVCPDIWEKQRGEPFTLMLG
ncbi:hypothetical protein BFJ70_g4405 [Fusarium oxysporum]|nr:hypothetical protein BFJ70_g4405 [Fusarium oxysporum]